MVSNEELMKYLLENRINSDGNLDLSNLDFSEFEGDVFTYGMKIKNNLYQREQVVGGDLYQDAQKITGCLFQHNQLVGEELYQHSQLVEGYFFTQRLKSNEFYIANSNSSDYVLIRSQCERER